MHRDDEFADPEQAQRLRDAYTGRHDVTDALWWRSHPLEPGPTGAPSPAAEAARLARQVFARGGADGATVVAHAAAQAQLQSDQRDLDNAIARARAAAPESERPPLSDAVGARGRGPETGSASAAYAASETDIDTDPNADTDATADTDTDPTSDPTRRRTRTVVVIAAAAVIVAAIVGLWVGMRLPGGLSATSVSYSGSFGPEPTPVVGTIAGTPTPSPSAFTAPALAVFDRAQDTTGADSDVPKLPDDAGFLYETDTFRKMLEMNSFPEASDSADDFEPEVLATIYAVKTTENRVCLIGVHAAHVLGSACAVEQDFPITGLQLSIPVGKRVNTITWTSGTLDSWSSNAN